MITVSDVSEGRLDATKDGVRFYSGLVAPTGPTSRTLMAVARGLVESQSSDQGTPDFATGLPSGMPGLRAPRIAARSSLICPDFET